MSLDTAVEARAQELAQQLGVPHVAATTSQTAATRPQSFDFELLIDVDSTLLQPRVYKSGPIGIDFNSGRNLHRLLHSGGRKQTLVKAVGIKRAFNRQQINAWRVLDTTSGFGRDAWALAAIGCRVTALERCIWLHDMQKQALLRASKTDIPEQSGNSHGQAANNVLAVQQTAGRIQTINTDAISWLQQQDGRVTKHDSSPDQARADVIYIDPMYPERKKSAAVKKEMQALHYLIGPDTDSDELLENACKAAKQLSTQRIVVKRPSWAEALPGYAGWQVVSSHSSENTRYDVYLAGD